MKIIIAAMLALFLSGCCLKCKREIVRLNELLTATVEACGEEWLGVPIREVEIYLTK